jgi:hypothetical protein
VDPADPDPQHCLAHDEAAEYLVEGVLVVQRTEDEALQAGLLHQDCVRQRLLALEGHRLSERIDLDIKNRGIFLDFFMYVLYSTLLHLPPSDSTVSEDAGI